MIMTENSSTSESPMETPEVPEPHSSSEAEPESVHGLLNSHNNIPSVIDKINWQEVKIIFLLGAVGGCVAGVLQVLDGKSADTISEYLGIILAFLTYPALGGIAAILGIYLVFGTPREDARRFVALSILCGISFSYIFEASKQIINIEDIENNLQTISRTQSDIQRINPLDITEETLDATVASMSDNIAVIEQSYLSAETPKEVRKIMQTTNLLKGKSKKLLQNENINSKDALLEKAEALNNKVLDLNSKLLMPAH